MMLSSINESYLLNESLAYHLSMNCFIDPIYSEEDTIAYSGLSSAIPGQQNSFSQHFEVEDEDEIGIAKKKPVSNGSSHQKQTYFDKKRKGFKKICDNVTLACMAKLFVIELNFKRRLSLMSNYLKRTVPWVLSSPNKDKRRETSELETSTEHEDNRSLRLGDYYLDETSFWNDLKMPKSSDCLGEQQEKILNRLTHIKRVSQKLFNTGPSDGGHQCNSSNLSSMNINFAEQQTCSERSDNQWSVFRQNEHPDGNTTPSMVASELIQSSLNPRIETPRVSCENVHCATGAGNSIRTAKTKIEAETTTSSRLTGIKRRKRIIAGGKQIKNVANALINSKQQKLCIVCYENSPNIVTLPCRHHEICSDCFIEIIYMAVKHSRYPLKCVLCRQKIEKIRCSRRLLLSVIERNRNK